ncbi:hypothetical protein GUJ93_ZPchr0001g33102 [Zizania palustris]|uniref:Clathrin/coatomer adaptor adaptin-like N-terminal domain-containing protein n=1 Tax=Zizania palustris TaxID=103762 RepID=A0A8J5RTN4_ZIZPA|nr:hypothetical protein GUJ93_ZPchr0001g33102 [Zizania palustris]
MLGHDASFGHIHAVKMTHDESLPLKRTGYLAVALFLDERHDLVILVVNTIQKDLRSDNYLVCAALTASCRLIGEEAIPAVLPQVVELLAHPKEAVRKKAVMALHRFYQRSPSSVSHLVSNFRKRLCDNDPGRRLPTSYDYHQMPAPFIQIKLLKILAVWVVVISKQVDISETTSKFLKSDSHNLKYMGIDALGRLIKINPDIAEEHQLAVIDCLEDPDDTLKRKTFELLYKMTKSTNVETMNKVFEHAGDLVNIRVAHNLMRLIAEGFGEEDEGADSQLRSSAVCRLLSPHCGGAKASFFVSADNMLGFGEYGTADGNIQLRILLGRYDVAEAHPTDDTVRSYAISAI